MREPLATISLNPGFRRFGTIQGMAGCGFRIFTLSGKSGKMKTSLFRQKKVPMSPARQPNGSPRRRGIARQAQIIPILQTERSAISRSAGAKKRRDFDPHAFLATIGEGRKFVLFPKKQVIFAQGDTADAVLSLLHI